LNRRGATLVEVLIAGALLVVLVAGFGQLLKFSRDYLTTANRFSRALYEARSLMEEMRGLPFAEIPKKISPRIKVVSLSAELCAVTVEIPWHPKRTPIRLYALRGKE
jgi:hypothetical protein